ncbi:MAG: hypothetical protein HOM03_06600, partial [Marinovum sp.]|nr:hypothetical protein [Marinovum sp.]
MCLLHKIGRTTSLLESSIGGDGLQSIPALLRRNAKSIANAPAYREKELGIWQSWTWSEAEK